MALQRDVSSKEILKAIRYRLQRLRDSHEVMEKGWIEGKLGRWIVDDNEARIDELESLEFYIKRMLKKENKK
jgi:hypothetical protein